ncbi:MAG: type II toxin-antitoxin system Phd/YefM family antitoxin [Lachnospiraceae bacterium]|nr:type II toxin-antitoxin system Phd/YefM family antitoxin [Lachnospiraceae bacterium]
MLAVKSMDVRDNFRDLCNKVVGGEIVVVSRPKNENIIMLSEKEFNELQKAKHNAEYLSMLDRSFEQLAHGDVVIKSMEELERMADE